MSPLHPSLFTRPARTAVAVACCLAAATQVAAQPVAPSNGPAASAVEESRQQERVRALREQQERAVDARLPAGPDPTSERLPQAETPCFRIDSITLVGESAERFQWLLDAASGIDADDSPTRRCLGARGIDLVLTRLQQVLIARGWVTSRVLAAPQDLTTGRLALTLVPGRIAAIRDADRPGPPTMRLLGALPMRPGDLLNLRDLEQGLENLQRLPSVEADIQIEPAAGPDARPGESDLVIRHRQTRVLRATLSLDDSGTRATGKTQAGATVAWDGPLGLNDLFYVSANHDAFNHTGQGTEGQTVHYSLPWGDWLVSATASNNRWHQSVAGLAETYVYAGRARHAEIRLSRLIHRDARRKITLGLRGFHRNSESLLQDTELPGQRRRVGGWELSLHHREHIGRATLDGTLAFRRGTGAFRALEAVEAGFGEGTSRMRLATSELALSLPFSLGEHRFRYGAQWRAQWNRTPLTPQDRFAIGSRYTVRGFDGESSLLGDRGWLVRNDLCWVLDATGSELYAGVDHGHVGGRATATLAGHDLTGAVIGLRGAWRGLGYDFFVGTPLRKPAGLTTPHRLFGFSLSYGF
ncbi:MAG: ShlB/FhaC/HecB family hemolysin secretion/activation protein [Comamonadaceae bacterium]|nr:MAG: ShlB/FhaC/HecB family hemolysin secretion/activation protein [Comamonadaceae bacterium]